MTEMDIQSISAHIEDQLRVSLSIAAQNGIEITREYVDDLLEPTAFMAVAAIPSISVADVIPLLDREGIIHRALVPFNVLVEDGWVLVAHDNHLPWLANRRKSIDWTHWDAYKQHLGNSIPPSAIIALDRITDEILDLSGDPNEKGPWDRRGLVMGNVQSGKTANYIGLINKAACAGYKVIIILAGLHNHLRAQTQHRVDEGITGRDSQNGLQGSKRLVGVGLLKTLQKYGFSVFTSADEHGDFNKRVAEQLQIP